MRLLPWLLVALGACAPSTSHRPAKLKPVRAAPMPAPSAPETPTEPPPLTTPPRALPHAVGALPAGLYFRNVWSSCPECTKPRVAVIADVEPGALAASGEATKALAASRSQAAGAGYPFAVHTDELFPVSEKRGVMIVLGLFATSEQAAAWLRDHQNVRARTVELAPEETIADFHSQDEPNLSRIVQVRSGKRVPAFTKEALTSFMSRHTDGDGFFTGTVETLAAGATPACWLEPNAVFVEDLRSLSDAIGVGETRNWVPVKCGQRAALVRRTHTRFHATIVPKHGQLLFRQTVAVECDTGVTSITPVTRELRIAGSSKLAHGDC